MRVLCVVFVVVSIGQACQGALLPRRHISTLRRTGPDPPEPADPATHRELKANNPSVPDVHHNLTSKAGTQTGPHRPCERPRPLQPVTVSVTDSKPPARPRRPLNPLLKEALNRAEDRRRHMRQLKPWTSHISPVDMPVEISCKDQKESSGRLVTAPPNVCDLCPDVYGKNPLAPCTCVGVGGSSAGQISINCPSELASLEQLKDIFQNTNFLSTHVFKFTLQDSCVDGALTRDIWGPLDFEYVFINNNRITDVDTGTFINSSDTLISLNLANNEIKNYPTSSDLPNLLLLDLRGNNLNIIYSDSFVYPNLQELYLSNNQINLIGYHAFAGLQKLRTLDLSHNQLTTIDDERFTFLNHDFSHALVINLSYNNISTISDTAFLGVQNVEIHFEYNQLHTLREQIFKPIIIDSGYFAFFHFMGNKIECDCNIKWAVEDNRFLASFDDFLCVNNGKNFWDLTVADLGNCTRSQEGSYS